MDGALVGIGSQSSILKSVHQKGRCYFELHRVHRVGTLLNTFYLVPSLTL
jgi:hypothetical protein